MRDAFGLPADDLTSEQTMLGGYWPAYLFRNDVINIPIAMGMVGAGGNAHAANEYYVVEGSGSTWGMADSEKSVATTLFSWVGLNKPE